MKRFYLLSIFFFIYCISIKAQEAIVNPMLSMEVHTTPVSGFLLPDSSVHYSDTTIFAIQLFVNLFDTTGFSSIHVKIGRTANSSDILDNSYDFDTYRTEYKVILPLGNYSHLRHYYAAVKLERTDGSLTDEIKFSR
jgi:hypothetical protein